MARLLLHGHGLKRGDRVGLLSHNAVGYVEAYYGILKAGGVAVPEFHRGRPTFEFLTDCGARFLIAGPKFDKPVTLGSTPCPIWKC